MGLVQMSCGSRSRTKICRRRWTACNRRPRRARRSSACRNFSRRSTSASAKTRRCLIWPNRFPDQRRARLARRGERAGVVLIASLFEKRAPGVYHNTAAIFDADGSAARHLSQDAHPGRSAVLREVLFHSGRSWVSARSIRSRKSRHAGLLGPVVSRRRAADGFAGRASCSFIRRRLAGILTRRREFGEAQYDAWQTIQRAHAIANGVYVAVVNRVGFENGRHSRQQGAGQRAGVLGRVVHRRSVRPRDRAGIARQGRDSDRRSRSARSSKTFAATGHSCATAGSIATRRSPAGMID